MEFGNRGRMSRISGLNEFEVRIKHVRHSKVTIFVCRGARSWILPRPIVLKPTRTPRV